MSFLPIPYIITGSFSLYLSYKTYYNYYNNLDFIEYDYVGKRPGEKVHEDMLCKAELEFTMQPSDCVGSTARCSCSSTRAHHDCHLIAI